MLYRGCTMDCTKINGGIVSSMNAMLLLRSSCQAVIEDEIQKVASDWYAKLDSELGAAENLVIEWRQSGYLYFQSDILNKTLAVAENFITLNAEITNLFNALENSGFDAQTRDKIASLLTQANDQVDQFDSAISGYLGKLQDFESKMQEPHGQMNQIIADVQAQEQKIQGEIEAINTHISDLQKQIATDRDAIAKAKKARKRGIIETIFGVIFAPVTGGLSLILAGIGASSISDAENQIHSMQDSIETYQGKITSEQSDLSNDEKTVATLKSLILSTGIVLSDISSLDNAMGSLRTSWSQVSDENKNIISQIQRSETAEQIIVQQTWWNAAVLEWNAVKESTQSLLNRPTDTTRVQVG